MADECRSDSEAGQNPIGRRPENEIHLHHARPKCQCHRRTVWSRPSFRSLRSTIYPLGYTSLISEPASSWIHPHPKLNGRDDERVYLFRSPGVTRWKTSEREASWQPGSGTSTRLHSCVLSPTQSYLLSWLIALCSGSSCQSPCSLGPNTPYSASRPGSRSPSASLSGFSSPRC